MSDRLLLDTSLVIAVFRRDPAAEQLVNGGSKTFLPVPALGELYVGVPRSQHPSRVLAQITSLAASVPILVCDEDTARVYGEIQSDLLAKGKPLPQNDVWIAAIARQHDLAVATRDAHFQQITGLAVVRI